ncbi:MAG: SUF system NifU family Fe-S cluster assembly protein [Candidatus Aenigmatarchaeota archaeon]
MREEIYTELIMEHYKRPRNFGKIKKPDVTYYDTNSLCGDEIEIYVKFSGKKINDIRFTGHGCAISQASASMITEFIKGKDFEFIKNLNKDDVLNLLGIDLSPMRLKCALLPLKAVKMAVYSHLSKDQK